VQNSTQQGPQQNPGVVPRDRAVRVVQLTDCHLGPNADYTLAGVRTYHSFLEVLQRLGADPGNADLVVVSGDIAAQGVAAAYQLFSREMRTLGLPFAWLPGNHDLLERISDNPLLPPFKPVVELGSWRLICLNTAVEDQVGGYLAAEQLAFLDASLQALQSHPVALFMHHPPTDIGCQWLDRQQVGNGAELAAIVRRHGNVKAGFSGHVHQEAQVNFAGIPFYTTPSTCFQFAAGSDDFALSLDPPAYRWIDLYPDGSHATGVIAIDNTREQVDTHTAGY